jgi:chorismate synthase
MNSFGRLFKISVFGESHGSAIGVTLDGVPAGIPLKQEDFSEDISRRKPGAAGTTPRQEDDTPELISGVFNDYTTGAPLTILFRNNNVRSAEYEKIRATPRPGHADFVLDKKYNGYNDYRGGGHSSGRLTLLLVAAGVIAKKIIAPAMCKAQLIEAGGHTDIEAAIKNAIEKQDSIGGIVKCSVDALPIGLGEPFFDSAESIISHLAFSIPAIKGIEFGSGFAATKMWGSEHNDAILDKEGNTASNHAGGVNGGITNGNQLVFNLAVKPTSSTPKEQHTWNKNTDAVESFTVQGRHDLCIALRVPVIAEAIAAIAIADLTLISTAYEKGTK